MGDSFDDDETVLFGACCIFFSLFLFNYGWNEEFINSVYRNAINNNRPLNSIETNFIYCKNNLLSFLSPLRPLKLVSVVSWPLTLSTVSNGSFKLINSSCTALISSGVFIVASILMALNLFYECLLLFYVYTYMFVYLVWAMKLIWQF